jgi:hypothetical protein
VSPKITRGGRGSAKVTCDIFPKKMATYWYFGLFKQFFEKFNYHTTHRGEGGLQVNVFKRLKWRGGCLKFAEKVVFESHTVSFRDLDRR